MRRSWTAVMLLAGVAVSASWANAAESSRRTAHQASPHAASAAPGGAQVSDQAQARVAQQVQQIQRLYEREEAALKQRLERAQQFRAAGLEKNDGQLLKQAEQLERQAFAEYERRIKQLDGLSEQISRSTEAAAQAAISAAANANAQAANQANRGQAASQRAPQRREPSSRSNRLFPFGR